MDLQALMKKNQENKERLAKERLQANQQVLLNYRIKSKKPGPAGGVPCQPS